MKTTKEDGSRWHHWKPASLAEREDIIQRLYTICPDKK